MKKYNQLLALVIMTFIAALGNVMGASYLNHSSKSNIPEATAATKSNINSGFVVSPYMAYFNPTGSNNDGLGGGVILDCFVNQNLGFGLDVESASGPDNVFVSTLHATYRFPIQDRFAPYVTIAGGIQNIENTDALLRMGAGLQYHCSDKLAVFADWQYGIAEGGGNDHNVVRTGVSIKF